MLKQRTALDVHPVYKRIDTCAAEFASPTAYMYSTYETPFAGKLADEAQVSDKKKVVILGGGPNRIGQGIEFDYCCCHAAFALADAGFESIMVNCNPETVSTDYDTSDRLYFEPLTDEDVLEILRAEQAAGTLVGVIVQFGGQTPLKLADALEKAGIPILGTAPDMIDLAEDRDRFQKLLTKLGLKQPNNGIAYSVEQARVVAGELGFPLVVRPSYVLGGRAMQIIHDDTMLQSYLLDVVPGLVPEEIRQKYPADKTGQINTLLSKNPLLFDTYLTESDRDRRRSALDGTDVLRLGASWITSRKRAIPLRAIRLLAAGPQRWSPELVASSSARWRRLPGAWHVRRADERAICRSRTARGLWCLRSDPRASRNRCSFRGQEPSGRPIAKIAARIMAGESLDQAWSHYGDRPDLKNPRPHRGQGSRLPLRPLPRRRHAARARDEVDRRGDGAGPRFRHGLCQGAKARRRRRPALPPSRSGHRLFVSCARRKTRKACCRPSGCWPNIGFRVLATSGTQRFLAENGIARRKVNKVLEGRPHIGGRHPQPPGPARLQHHRRPEGGLRLKIACAGRLMQKVPYYTPCQA